MRTKTFVILLACVLITSILLCLLGSQQPAIQSIVSETHKHINYNLKTLKENLIPADEKKLEVDEKYLELLGFVSNPVIYPNSTWKTSLPIIVTAVHSSQGQMAVGFMESVQHFLPDISVLLYDLGLGFYELDMVQSQCNTSHCSIVHFDLEQQFPSHLKSKLFKAYQPVLIQDALNKGGAVLWLEVEYRFTSAIPAQIIESALETGVASWYEEHSTSAVTHPRMFEYFRSIPENFFFQRLVTSDHILLINTAKVHRQLMLPWVQCALIPECIAPIGAQAAGCRFNKKPHYRYSGCHRYATSALNLALGPMFGFNENSYVYSGKEKLPVRIGEEMTEDSENISALTKDE